MKYNTPNKDFESTIRQRLKGQHFMHLMGFDLTAINPGSIEGEMAIEQRHHQQFGFVHGGVTSTILDITMGFAAFTLVEKGFGVVTANLNVDYFKPGVGEKIVARSFVEKAGARFFVCKGNVYTVSGGEELLIASGSSVMAVIAEPEKK